MSHLCCPARVFAFDLQSQAIAATYELLTKAGFAAEITDATQAVVASTCSVQFTPDSMRHSAGCDPTALTPTTYFHSSAGTAPDSATPENPRIILTCLGHEHLGAFFGEQCDPGESVRELAAAILFNLGYLPGGDKALTTRADTTLTAVQAALQLLDENGLLCITMYDGHPAGAEEKRALLDFAAALDPRRFHVGYLNMLNQPNQPPEILLITRKR